MSKVEHLLKNAEFRNRTSAYNEEVKKQWERLQNVDPDLTEVLELTELSREQLNAFCAICAMIRRVPDCINEDALEELDVADYKEEMKISHLPIGNVATRLVFIPDKGDRVPVKERIAKLLFLIRQN